MLINIHAFCGHKMEETGVVAWPRIAGVGENHVLFKRLDEIILSFVS